MMLIIQTLAITILITTAAAAETTCRRNRFGTTTCSMLRPPGAGA